MSPEVFTGHRNVIQDGHLDTGVTLVRGVLHNGQRIPHGNAEGQQGRGKEVLVDANKVSCCVFKSLERATQRVSCKQDNGVRHLVSQSGESELCITGRTRANGRLHSLSETDGDSWDRKEWSVPWGRSWRLVDDSEEGGGVEVAVLWPESAPQDPRFAIPCLPSMLAIYACRLCAPHP